MHQRTSGLAGVEACGGGCHGENEAEEEKVIKEDMMKVEDEDFDKVLENGDLSADFYVYCLSDKQTGDIY